MVKKVIHTCSAPYQKSMALRAFYYESDLADIQTCVEHLFFKDLGEGTLAVYGSYSVFFLFTHTAFSGRQCHYPVHIRQIFSVLLKGGVPDTDAVELRFVPHVTAHPADAHAIQWHVEIKAEATAIFYAETPDESAEPALLTPQGTTAVKEPVKDEAEPPVEKKDVQFAQTDRGSNAPASAEKDSPKTEKTTVRFWKIRSNTPLSLDSLLEMDEKSRNEFLEKEED